MRNYLTCSFSQCGLFVYFAKLIKLQSNKGKTKGGDEAHGIFFELVLDSTDESNSLIVSSLVIKEKQRIYL